MRFAGPRADHHLTRPCLTVLNQGMTHRAGRVSNSGAFKLCLKHDAVLFGTSFPSRLLPPQCGFVSDELRSGNLDARLNRGFDRHLIDRERQGSRNSQVKRSRENPRAKRERFT